MGGLLKDGEECVAGLGGLLDALRQELPELRGYVFENNSRDRTSELLQASAAERPHLNVRSETWDLDAFREGSKARTWDNKPCRLELIAEARNRLLDWMREDGLAPGDRVVIIDWDFREPPPLDALMRHIRELPESAAAIFANGVDSTGRYYDLYELRTKDHPFGPELIGNRFWTSRRRRRNLARVIDPAESPIEVYSAFGGLAIYRGEALDGCRYSPYPTVELDSFYKERLEEDPSNREARRLRRGKLEKVRDGMALGAHLFDEELFYLNNSGYNFPIAAEHVNVNLAIRARNRGGLFIEPSLTYFSRH
jgi:hypothetical protein